MQRYLLAFLLVLGAVCFAAGFYHSFPNRAYPGRFFINAHMILAQGPRRVKPRHPPQRNQVTVIRPGTFPHGRAVAPLQVRRQNVPPKALDGPDNLL